MRNPKLVAMIYDPNSTEFNSEANVLEHPANDTLEQMPLSLLPEPFKQMSEAISTQPCS